MSSNNYTKLSIIVLGETGQGKSLFCKLFSKSDFFISADTGESVTIDVKTKTFRDDNKMVEICLIDTPGSNDSRGKEQSEANLNIIKNEILLKPRINCVIIVMNAQNPRMTDSIKTSIRNICSAFPLPDFWEHVIIFWTHFFFQDKNQYKRKKERIETDIMREFRRLSVEVNRELRIKNIEEKTILHMIYNEYDEYTANEEIRKRDLENTEKNFGIIIDLVKKMKPLYEQVYPPEYKDELQEPKSGTKLGNNTKFLYKKKEIRKYKDFKSSNILHIEDVIGEYTITMQEKESDWEYNEGKNKKIKYTIREFYNEKNEKIPKPNEIQNKEKEIKYEVDIKKKTTDEISNNRIKRYEVDCLIYPGSIQEVEENKKFLEEIEEGETEWEEDQSFHEENTKKYNKYKTITRYNEKGAEIGKKERKEVVEWKTIETKIEDNIKIEVNPTLTRYIKRTTITETSSKDNIPKIISKNDEDVKTEEIKEEPEVLENLDNYNIGTVKYNFYKVKYINNVKDVNYREKNEEKSYIVTYEKGEKPMNGKVTKDGKDYEESYYEIYMTDSRNPNYRKLTNYRYPIGDDKLLNTITKNIMKEISRNAKYVKKQNFKQYFKIESNGQEVFISEEKAGDSFEEEIQTSKEYYEIEAPMTIEKINDLKKNKKYPINYVRNYFKKETNTEEQKIIFIKSEKVEIRLEHKSEIKSNKNINGKEIKEKEEYDVEHIYINGKFDSESKTKLNSENKRILNIIQYVDKVKKGKISKWFTPDEHHYDIVNVTRIIFADGKTEEIRDFDKSVVERFNEKK